MVTRRRKKCSIFEKRIFHFMLKVKFFFDFAFLKTISRTKKVSAFMAQKPLDE